MKTFVILSEFAEILDLGLYLQNVEKQKVLFVVGNDMYKRVGENMILTEQNWWRCIGKGYVWLIDGCAHGNLQDWLRSKGEMVFGGSEIGDKLENERQLGQKWFKMAGFYQPMSKTFKGKTSFEDAIGLIKSNLKTRFILKQLGEAPKSLNYMAKFDDNQDLLDHLEKLKKKWNEAEYGNVEFQLMEVVEGVEVAASAFFNGKDFVKNSQGKIIGFLNFEEKKEATGGLGGTCGEMGTTFYGCDETNQIFKDILLRPKIRQVLKEIGFRGVFDINGCLTKKGFVAFEPTDRFGVPASSYEFLEGMRTPLNEALYIVAKGEDKPIDIKYGWGIVMVIAAKPFPDESGTMPQEETSIGEKLWILKNGKPIKDFDAEQKKHIHLENFLKTDRGDYEVATKNGYLLTVTGRNGSTIEDIRNNLISYIKSNVYISGMKYRIDIGKRVEKYAKMIASGKVK